MAAAPHRRPMIRPPSDDGRALTVYALLLLACFLPVFACAMLLGR